jgi:heat shock protein HslJ
VSGLAKPGWPTRRLRAVTLRRVAGSLITGSLIVALGLSGCVGGPVPTPRPTPPPNLAAGLDGRTFLSTAVTVGGVAKELVAGTRIRLAFKQDAISAAVGCNIFGATFHLAGAILKISGGAMTEMGCDEPRQAQDEWLFGLLGSSPTLGLAGDQLTITAGSTFITLLDRRIAEPDLPLTGRTWTLESIIADATASSVPAGVTVTIEFGADGRITVASGCNTGAGGYTVGMGASASTGTLVVSDLAMTKKACPGAAGSVETSVLGVLRAGTIAFEIEASQLRLRAGDAGLDFRA